MGEEVQITPDTGARRYQAVVRISEALVASRQPEELAKTLADLLGEFLSFDHLDVLIFKENSTEIEWHVWGKGGPPHGEHLPVEDLPRLPVYSDQELVHIADWNADERYPRLKQFTAEKGMKIGSVVRIPLTTPHRRLGALGIASAPGVTYGAEDIEFLRLVARVVAFAIDDGLNLKRAQAAHTRLQVQYDRLQLLLNVTNRITSNIEFHELLRAIAANIREVLQTDSLVISLPDAASGKSRVLAIDFPQAQAVLRGEFLVTTTSAGKRALETSRPVIADWRKDRAELDAMTRKLGIYDIADVSSWKSRCVIPLVNRGQPLGLLSTARKTEAPFTAEEVEFLAQLSGQIAIAIENALAYQEISELKDKLAQEKLYLEDQIRTEMNFGQIVGTSPALKQVLELVNTVASSDSTVLVLGETGTGKELIARAIHDHSQRGDRTFVKLNCAAIPTGLLESELFGHEKGAFTGAISQKIGRMELADRGTLFLDEVGDIPIEIQPKLLRALQEREFERLGSTHTRKVNVRLIAATNRDLEKMVADKEFRSDLYYRLNVFPIRVPPLRERREDIPLLASYFVQKCAKQMQKKIESIPTGVMKGLTAWDWPGNIRELENFIERAVILTRGKSLEAPLAELRKKSTGQPAVSMPPHPGHTLGADKPRADKEAVADEYEERKRDEIVRALIECKGRVGGVSGAAALLGVNRSTLLTRMRKFGIYPKQYA
jgi:formate hydrogenlyase transcriptional activator